MKKTKRKTPRPRAAKPAKEAPAVHPHRFGQFVIPKGAVLRGGIFIKVS